jgi:hypothetical protein
MFIAMLAIFLIIWIGAYKGDPKKFFKSMTITALIVLAFFVLRMFGIRPIF